MLGLILCLIPIPIMIWNFFLLKKRESISFEMRKGWICHCCKKSNDMTDVQKLNKILSENNYHICTSCSRDRKLKILRYPILKWIYKFWDEFTMSSSISHYSKIYIGLIFFLIAIDMIFLFNGLKIRLSVFYGLLNFIYWILNTSKTYYTSINKS